MQAFALRATVALGCALPSAAPAPAQSWVKAGRVRALAVTSPTRSPVAPDLPSLEQSGYKGSSGELWWGVPAPAGAPQPLVDRLDADIERWRQVARAADIRAE